MGVKQKVIDRGWNKILENHKNIKKLDIKVGLFGENADYKNNMAMLGAVHQFGSTKMNIPKRPFISEAFDAKEQENKNFIVNEYRKVIDGKQNLKKMIDRIGVKHEGQIKKGITEFNFAPNKPKTVQRKGSSTPLIDSGQMRNSVKYKVVSK